MPRHSLTLDARESEIDRLHAFVEAFAEAHRLPPRLSHHLVLALEELFSNVAKYGAEGGADDGATTASRPRVRLVLRRQGEIVAVSVADDGVAFDPLQAGCADMDGTVEERPVGGLGVYLVRSLMDEVRYARRGGRNHLFLVKRIAGQTA